MILNIHSHINSADSIQSFDLLSCAEEVENLYSIGIHPWNTNALELSNKEISKILEFHLGKKNCVALGECGLDKLKGADFKKQIELFKLQLELAEKYNKPVIIHCVKAFNELIILRKKFINGVWISHGFRGKKELALSLERNNINLSFGTHLLHDTQVQKTFCALNIHRIFLETDEQEPSDIYKLMEHAAALKNVSLEAFKQILQNNINQTFNIL